MYWKNRFEFTMYGTNGFISINGLGGSYGEEKLVLGHRNFEGGKPKIENFSFSAAKSIVNDDSWRKEWEFFRELIRNEKSSDNGYQANLIVDAIYDSSEKKPTS